MAPLLVVGSMITLSDIRAARGTRSDDEPTVGIAHRGLQEHSERGRSASLLPALGS